MPGDRDASPGEHNWWQADIASAGSTDRRLVVVASRRHPDGERVRLAPANADEEIGADAVCTAVISAAGVVGLHLGARLIPDAPALWYAELDETEAEPPAISLIAFTGADQSAGAVLDEAQLADVWVDSDDQLGAIRWFRQTGEVDQVYVAPQLRRRGLGSALIAAAATLQVARDLPRLWGSGRRTALGEELRNARSWRARTAELSELAEPMTPS